MPSGPCKDAAGCRNASVNTISDCRLKASQGLSIVRRVFAATFESPEPYGIGAHQMAAASRPHRLPAMAMPRLAAAMFWHFIAIPSRQKPHGRRALSPFANGRRASLPATSCTNISERQPRQPSIACQVVRSALTAVVSPLPQDRKA